MKPIDWGSFNRTAPIDFDFGRNRGTPIDRYYIEKFLEQNKNHIRGSVLEFETNRYTKKFGKTAVTKSHVMDKGNRKGATIVGDLDSPDCVLPHGAFDCVIVTQVLQYMNRPRGAVRNLWEATKQGGWILGSWATISHGCGPQYWTDRFFATAQAVEHCIGAFFDELEVKMHGNVLAATSFLWGLAAEELSPSKLDLVDKNYCMLVTFKGRKLA